MRSFNWKTKRGGIGSFLQSALPSVTRLLGCVEHDASQDRCASLNRSCFRRAAAARINFAETRAHNRAASPVGRGQLLTALITCTYYINVVKTLYVWIPLLIAYEYSTMTSISQFNHFQFKGRFPYHFFQLIMRKDHLYYI